MTKDKKYKKEYSGSDWTITINPEYVEPKFISLKEIVILILGIAGGVASMLIYDWIKLNNGDKNEQVIEFTQTGKEKKLQQSESVSNADSTEIKIVPADSSK